MERRSFCLLMAIPCFTLSQATFGQATFQGLGNPPGSGDRSIALDVSAVGDVVVGQYRIDPDNIGAFRWQDGVMTPLTGLGVSQIALAVSADGSVIVGQSWNESGENWGFRWEDGSMQPLNFQGPKDVSADGTIIVGFRHDQVREGAVLWKDGELTDLPSLSGCADSSQAFAVSPDGVNVAGLSNGSIADRCQSVATVWRDGIPVRLGYLPGGGPSAAHGISSDGSVLVGDSISGDGHRAVIWRDGVIAALGDTGEPPFKSKAEDVSADGRVVVGYAAFTPAPDQAMVWVDGAGPRSILALLEGFGVDLTGWLLERAHAVSADGSTIVGYGTNPDGEREAWVAVLPYPPGIVSSVPPDGSIDARQDFSTTGRTPHGLDRIRVAFSPPAVDATTYGLLTSASFELVDTAGTPPDILSVVPLSVPDVAYEVVFSDPITPGAWSTLIAHVAGMDGTVIEEYPFGRVNIGFLPGDVNGDGTSSPAIDLSALIDCLNNHGSCDDWQVDINRDSTVSVPDLTRLIDLFNGANTSRSWVVATLPERP